MDAKSKADFINSVAGGQKIPCPNCNALNEPDFMFCYSCGAKFESRENVNADSVSQPQQAPVRPAFQTAAPAPAEEPEKVSVFAQGIPDWDMLPPQVVVRRKKK